MSTPTNDSPVLPPKIPTSKPPSIPDRSKDNRMTMNGKQPPTTPPPPIPPRSDNVGQNSIAIPQTNLITHKKVVKENSNGSIGGNVGGNMSNNNSSGHLSPSNSPSQNGNGLSSFTPQSPQTHSSSPNSQSPRPVSHSPQPTNGRPLPSPKENTNENISRNSFQQVLQNHPLSNQNHSNPTQYNTAPHPNKQPPAIRKLPPPPIPNSRNTINISNQESGNNVSRQPPPLPPSYQGTLKKQNSSCDPETFAVQIPENNNININISSNQIVSIINASYPSLEHFNQFTSTRDLKVKEVLITERTYVDNMRILVEIFIDPLKSGDGGISKDHAIIICSNLTDILTISVELLKGLENKISEWSETQTIGDVFKNLIPFLKMYTHYTVGYDNVMNIVSECEKNSSFTSFIQRCTEDPRTKKLDLRSYLIQPVQRITRYHMLLEEVLKHTPNTHPDFEDLQKSYLEMKKVTSDANEAIKKSENRAKVFEIQKMFMKDPEIVAAHRAYIFDGVLTKVCRKACKKRYVFLFSDLLVYGSSIPPKLLLHEKIELENCRMEDIPDGSTNLTNNGNAIINAFQIHSNKKSFVVFADTQDLKMKWMLYLAETISQLQERRKTIKSEKIQRSEAPVWVPDESNPNCTQCNGGFSFYNRRHHCRKCGALVCHDCSSNKFKLPISDFKPVRVCNKCFTELNQNQSTQKIDD